MRGGLVYIVRLVAVVGWSEWCYASIASLCNMPVVLVVPVGTVC